MPQSATPRSQDRELAGVAVELDLDEAPASAGTVAVRGRLSSDPMSPPRGPPKPGRDVQVGRHVVPVELPPSSMARRAAAYGELLRRVGAQEQSRRRFVIGRRAAEIHRGDLFELGDGVQRGGMVRPRHRERGVAAELTVVPRQMLAAVAAHDDAVVPLHFQHLGRDSGRARVRIGAEVADARVNVKLAVGG